MNDASFYGRARFLVSETTGALAAAIITIPQAIAYGLIAFAALGSGFAADAVFLGLYSAVLAGFLAALTGGTPIQITGPKASLTLLIASVVATLSTIPDLPQETDTRIDVLILLTSICVLIAGLFQLLLGSIRFGNIVKFVPHSVISGVTNGVAIWLILSQLKPLLGIPAEHSLWSVFRDPSLIQPLSLCVGIVTLAGIYIAKRYYKQVPHTLAGLLVGSFAYYAIFHLLPGQALGPTLGTIEFQWPQIPDTAQLSTVKMVLDPLLIVPVLVVSGVIVGLIASTDSLLTSVVSDNLTGTRHRSNRELVGQGLGNIACAAFGALPAAGSIPRTIANYNAGGRTRLSGMLSAVIILVTSFTLGPALGKLPLLVIAAIIIVVGIDLFDSWTINLIKKLKTHALHRRDLIIELFIIAAVATLTVTVNLMIAVIAGMIMASALLIWELSKSIVRRHYAGNSFHSRKLRGEQDYQALAHSGEMIRVFELQGPLFFGAADELAGKIENIMQHATYCILDMQRVTDIDATGARILARTADTLRGSNKHLLICHLSRETSTWGFIEMMGVIPAIDDKMFFQDIDHALEWAEDHSLAGLERDSTEQFRNIAGLDLMRGLTETELELISRHLTREQFPAGTHVFTEDEENYDAFVVMSGSITISKRSSSGATRRLITFGQGSLLGEMGFVDQRARSATAHADEDSELLRFSYSAFQALQKQEPQIAAKILANIAREISSKLRRTSKALAVLEDA